MAKMVVFTRTMLRYLVTCEWYTINSTCKFSFLAPSVLLYNFFSEIDAGTFSTYVRDSYSTVILSTIFSSAICFSAFNSYQRLPENSVSGLLELCFSKTDLRFKKNFSSISESILTFLHLATK